MSSMLKSGKAVQQPPTFEGVPIAAAASKVDWKTTRILEIEGKGEDDLPRSVFSGSDIGRSNNFLGKLRRLKRKVFPERSKYESSMSGSMGRRKVTSKSGKIKVFEVLCLWLNLYACFAFPLLCVYYSLNKESLPGYETRLVLVIVNDLVLCGAYFLDTSLMCRLYKRSLLNEVLFRPSVFLSVIPWGALAYMMGAAPDLVATASMFLYARIFQVYFRYAPSAVDVLKWYIHRPPAPLVRLAWLAISVIIIMNLFGSIYFYLAITSTGYSWIDYDDLRNNTSTRIAEDDMNRANLRYARSVYFVYQTLLTVGYGDVAPYHMWERLFGAFLCLFGVFILAYMIANMTSYLMNMDATTSSYRGNVEKVEFVMGEMNVSYKTKLAVRQALGRMWKEGKGVTKRTILNDLPPSIVDRFLDQQLSKLADVPFLQKPGEPRIYRPVAFFILESLKSTKVVPGTRLLPSKRERSMYGPILTILLTGTARKVVPRATRTGLVSNKIRRMSSKFQVAAEFVMKSQRVLSNATGSMKQPTSMNQAESSHSGASSKAKVAPIVSDVDKTSNNNDAESVLSTHSTGKDKPPLLKRLSSQFSRQSSMHDMSDLEGESLDPRAIQFHETYPLLISFGQTIGSATFFGDIEHPPPSYVAITPCEVINITQAEFRKMATLFPEWGMEKAKMEMGTSETGLGLDPRIDAQIRAEQPEKYTESKKMMKSESSNDLNRIRKMKKLKRQETKRKMEQLKKSWCRFQRGGVTEVIWDAMLLVVILYNCILIPLRLAAMNSEILLEASIGLTIIDVLGDIFIVMNRFLKPVIFLGLEGGSNTKNDNEGSNWTSNAEAMLVHKTLTSKTKKNTAPGLNQEALAKVIDAEKQTKRKQRMEKRIYRLRVAIETLMMIVSLCAFGWLLSASIRNDISVTAFDDVKKSVNILRAPFLIRTFMIFELYALLTKHYIQYSRNKHKAAANLKMSHGVSASSLDLNAKPESASSNNSASAAASANNGGNAALNGVESTFLSAKLLIWFILFAHWIACYGMTILDVSSDTRLYTKYMLGLYWSLTTMTTVGFGDISPSTGKDSLTTSFIAVCGVAAYSIFVSLIGTYFKDVELSSRNVSHYRACLTVYLTNREISSGLQNKVWQYLEYLETHDMVLKHRVLDLTPEQRHGNPSSIRAFAWANKLQVTDSQNGTSNQEDGDSTSTATTTTTTTGAARDALVTLDHNPEDDWAQLFAHEPDSYERLTQMKTIYSPIYRESEILPSKERALIIRDIFEPQITTSKLFQGVSNPYISELAALVKLEIVCPGERIACPEYRPAAMFIVYKGKLEEKDEQDIRIRELNTNASFHELGLGLHCEYEQQDEETKSEPCMENTCFTPVEISQIWKIERRDVLQLAELYPKDHELVLGQYTALCEKLRAAKNANNGVGKRKGGKLGKLAGGASEMSFALLNAKRRKVFTLDSRFQQNWNNLMFLVLVYNLVAYPLRLAFFLGQDLPITSYTFDYLLDFLLLVDVFLRFRYFELETAHGERISDPDMIRRYYGTSWFGLCDMIAALTIDLIGVAVLGGNANYLPLMRTNKLFRGLRLVQHIKSLGKNIKNQAQKSLVTIVKLVFALLLLAHWNGCLFYLIGKKTVQTIDFDQDFWSDDSISAKLGQGSWVDGKHANLLLVNGNYSDTDMDWTDHYLYAFYFAVTTVTGVGYGDIVPVATTEIAFTIFILVGGGVLYSLIIAFLEDIIAQADITSVLHQLNTNQITLYTTMARLPTMLRAKVKDSMMQSWMQEKGVTETSILGFLSPNLKKAIILELLPEAVFKRCPVIGPANVWHHVIDRLELFSIPAQTIIFERGEKGTYLYFVISGTVDLLSADTTTVYATVQQRSMLGQDGFFRLGKGYEATARTNMDCSLARLKQSDLVQVLQGSEEMRQAFLIELERFVEKPSFLELTRKNFDKRKLTQMMAAGQAADETNIKPKEWLDRYIIHPNTRFYSIWHVILLVVTMYNSFAIPLNMGTREDVQTKYAVTYRVGMGLNVVTDLFLLAHVIMNATIISRVVNGLVLRSSKEIRRSFLKKRSLLKVVSIFPIDYVIFFITGSTVYASIGRSGRFYWLFYVPRFWTILDDAIDSSSSISISSGYRHLMKIVFVVLLVSHWLACIHMLVVTAPGMPEEGLPAHEAYINSIYYILYTMTTVGYGNVSVATHGEKVFAMLVMILGAFLCDAGITSTLSSVFDIEDSSAAASNRVREGALQFFATSKVPPMLQDDMNQYYRYRLSSKHDLNDQDIISRLSPSLALQVTGFILHRSMGRLPEKTAQLVHFSPGMLRTLVLNMKYQLYVDGDVLFHSGERICRLIFVVDGTVKVHLNAPNAFSNMNGSMKVKNKKSPPTTTTNNSSLAINNVPPQQQPQRSSKIGMPMDEPPRRRSKFGRLKQSFTVANERGMRALHSLENNEDQSRCKTLLNPGLLLPNRAFGEMTKETVVCKSVCSAWVCDRELVSELMALQPTIGGFFYNLEEMIANPTGSRYFGQFLRKIEGHDHPLQFLIAVIGYRKNANNENVRIKKSIQITEKFLQHLEIDQQVKDRLADNYKSGSKTVFDEAYRQVVLFLEETIPLFKSYHYFHDMVEKLHEEQRSLKQTKML